MICLKGCSCFMGLLLPEKFRKISYWLGYLNRFANRELIPYAKCYSIDCCHILEIELICKRNFTGPIQDCNIEVFHYVSLNPHVLQRTFYLFEKIPRGGVLEPRAITPTSVTAFQRLTLRLIYHTSEFQFPTDISPRAQNFQSLKALVSCTVEMGNFT